MQLAVGVGGLFDHWGGVLTRAPRWVRRNGFEWVQLMVQHRVARPNDSIALWFHTSRLEELYRLFKSRQLASARAALAGGKQASAFRFEEDLYAPHYGGRQFSISDLNGFELVFQSE